MLGLIALQWSIIPLHDVNDRTLFSKVLSESGHEYLWMSSMMAVGLMLAISSVVKWRNMLMLSEGLSVILWLGLFALFAPEASYAPVVKSFPVFSVCMFLCLLREVVFGARVIGYREAADGIREIRGVSDMRT